MVWGTMMNIDNSGFVRRSHELIITLQGGFRFGAWLHEDFSHLGAIDKICVHRHYLFELL